jgi:type II secretion system protein I
MVLSARPVARPGLSLLEVLVALAIFLMSFIAIGRLVTFSTDHALDVQMQSQATQMAQSKLNEVIIGSLPLSSQSGTIDQDTAWNWSVDAEQGDLAALWTVKVRVWRQVDDHEVESTLTQMVLDPTYRGSIFDQMTVTGISDTAPANSGNSSSASPNSSGGQQGATGAAAVAGGSNAKGGNNNAKGGGMTGGNNAKGGGMTGGNNAKGGGNTPNTNNRNTTPNTTPNNNTPNNNRNTTPNNNTPNNNRNTTPGNNRAGG